MVTDYSGVNYANTQAKPQELIEQGQQRAPEFHILDQFVLTADFSAGDRIFVGGPIPQGAVLINCVLTYGALGGSCALDVGHDADDDAFFNNVVCSSAGVSKAHGDTYEGAFYTQAPLSAQVQPVITCAVASSGGTGKSIMIDISYCKSGG